MTDDLKSLLERRNHILDRLQEIWDATKNAKDDATKKAWQKDIWRKANTAQALLQYWRTEPATNQKGRQKALDLMWEAYDFYVNFTLGAWVDDFGWWHGFFRDAFDAASAGFPLTGNFKGLDFLPKSEECYTKMLINFDNQKKGTGNFYLGEGGIWNHRPTDVNEKNCGDCEKNTVTNAWLLNVAGDLFVWTERQIKYKNMAEAQYLWLTTGIYGNYTPKWDLYTAQGLLWWVPDPDKSAGVYWSGDVGVFLRGVDRYIRNVDSTNQIEIVAASKKLIDAAITPTADFEKAAKGFPDTKNIMHESPRSMWSISDLDTGKGVFMRLVTLFVLDWGYFQDPDFKNRFKTFVNASAEAAWASRDQSNNSTKSSWNTDSGPDAEKADKTTELWPQVYQTNGLDVLNAAVQILQHP